MKCDLNQIAMENENINISVLVPILKKIPIFASLDENLHKEMIQHIVLMYYPSEYTMFKQGDDGDALYIVKQGQIEIYKEPETEADLPKSLSIITDGGFFGEMALISDMPRNASAKALVDSEIFILSKADFKKLLDTNTTLAEQISATVVSRTKENEL